MNICPLCSRELGDVNIDEHHLIPKCKRGKVKEMLHRVCHMKIHSVFTEKELEQSYNTWESIKSHEEIAKFIRWVQKRPLDFIDTSKETSHRKSKRR